MWDDAEFISKNFIPVVFDGDCAQRQPMVGKFMATMKGHFANEFAVTTPNAKILSSYPAEGLAKWSQLPEAERKQLKDFGAYDATRDPVPPPNGLILKVYARGLERGAEGQWSIYRHPKAHLTQEPGRDYLWLTEAEWKSLIPADAKPGDKTPVPAPLTKRICAHYLIDLVRIGGNGHPRDADSTLGQELTLTVEQSTPTTLRLRLDGSARYLTRGENHGVPAGQTREDAFTVLGYLDYDKAKSAVTRFDIVALSDTGHYDEIGQKLTPLGVAYELSEGKTDADRARPSSLYEDYFGKGH